MPPAMDILTRISGEALVTFNANNTCAIYLELDNNMKPRPWRSGIEEARLLFLEGFRVIAFGITPEKAVLGEGSFFVTIGCCYLPLWLPEEEMRHVLHAKVLNVQPMPPPITDAEIGLKSTLSNIRHRLNPARVSLVSILNSPKPIPEGVRTDVIGAAVDAVEKSMLWLRKLVVIRESLIPEYVSIHQYYFEMNSLLEQISLALTSHKSDWDADRCSELISQISLRSAILLLDEFEIKSKDPLVLNSA